MFPHIRWRLLSALPRLYLLQHSRSRSTPRPVLQFFTSFLPYYCYNRRGYAEVTNSAFYRHLSVAASANSDGQQPGTISSLRVDIEDVSGAIADSFCDCVLEIGATSAMTEEFRPHGAQEEAIFAHDAREDIGSTTSQEGPRLWKRCTVVVHFPPDLTTTEAKKHIKRVCNSLGLDFNEDSLKLSYVRAQDWEQVIRNGYQPMKVTDTLYILPSWSKPVEKNATNVILEPGLAFGTGHHPTTSLCLAWLESLSLQDMLKNRRCMDYGTGSGVLACAACVLGAKESIGVDIEKQSIIAAQQNAALNGISDTTLFLECLPDTDPSMEPLLCAGVPEEQRRFDIVMANILSGPLQQLAPRLSSYALPGALLALSGILESQVDAISETYSSHGFTNLNVRTSDGWALVTGEMKLS